MNETKRFNPWPYAIIAFFVFFFLVTIGLISVAMSQRNDLVSADYYEQEVHYQGRLDGMKRALDPTARIQVRYHAATGRLVITLPPEHAAGRVTGGIQLYRPSAAWQDRQFELKIDAHGEQTLDLANLASGLWHVRVHWTFNAQEYYADQSVVIPRALKASS